MNMPPKKRLPNMPQAPQALNAARPHPITPSAGRAKPITRPPLPATPCQLKRRPCAPEVYRPQPVPRVLQTKKINGPTLPKTPPINNVQKAILTKSAPRPVPHKYKVNYPSRPVMQLAAEEKKKSHSTKITLTISDESYSGTSGGGHAEMNALDYFLRTCGETKAEAFKTAKRILTSRVTKKVSCIGKAVCGSCSKVLQALGFTEDAETKFSTEKSGGVAWGATKLVEEFMEHMGLETVFAEARRDGAK